MTEPVKESQSLTEKLDGIANLADEKYGSYPIYVGQMAKEAAARIRELETENSQIREIIERGVVTVSRLSGIVEEIKKATNCHGGEGYDAAMRDIRDIINRGRE